MPFTKYGVAIGTFVRFTRDPSHHYGSWYHGHVTVDADGAEWESALDVDAPAAVGIAYRLVTGLSRSDLGPVGSLPLGWTTLAPSSTSGALDYVRSPILQNSPVIRLLRRALPTPGAPEGWTPPPPDVGMPGGPDPADYPPAPYRPDRLDTALRKLVRFKERFEYLPIVNQRSFPWISSNGDNALNALEPHLKTATRIYLFGEPYRDGDLGVHNVHMNQGDPAGSRWYASNGIWQDGAVACESADGEVAVWQIRFMTQSMTTDENGHPI